MANVTTVEVARRACRHLSVKDPSGMDPSQAMELVDAINAATFLYFEQADQQYKRTTATELLLAPVSRTISLAAGGTTLTSGAFLNSERGKAVLIPDDPDYNEIVATDQVLRPYRGSGGSVSATIYSDCVAIRDFSVERVVNDPRIVDTNTTLTNTEKFRQPGAVDPWYRATARRTLGDPRYYMVQHVGGSIATSSNDAVVQIKLDPIPARALTIEFDIFIRGATVGIDALTSPVALPIDSTVLAVQFLPLVEGKLLSSSLWAGNDRVTSRVEKEEMAAIASIRNLTSDFARPHRRVGTTFGF